MSEALGITKEFSFETINGPRKIDDDEIRMLRIRFQSYVDTYGRAVIEKDLAKPPHMREIIKFAEIAVCLWAIVLYVKSRRSTAAIALPKIETVLIPAARQNTRLRGKPPALFCFP